MYRLLGLFLVLSAMSLTWAFEDYYEEPIQRTPAPQNFGHHRNEHYNEDRVQRADNVHARHTHTRTRADAPEFQRLSNGPTTVKNYIESASLNTNSYFNSSGSNSHLAKNNNSKRKSQEFQDGMVYPSDLENLSIKTNELKSRSCSYGLCDEVDDYPTEKIERILRQSELNKFFRTEVKFENRFADTDGENLCATITHTRFPKTAKNIQDKEQVIVNVDQYKQGVEFETCKEEGPCSFAENFPNNFTPKCVQKYTVRKLMVVGKESDDTVFDYFKIPSCCVCMVKK